MKEILGNGLDTIVSQALQKMKEEQGESFRIETVNLAALQRMTGISRARLRRWKRNLLSPEQCSRKKKSILSDYTSVLDHLLSSGISNTVICFERLKQLGYTGGHTTVKCYIRQHKYLIPAKRKQVAPQGNRGRRYHTSPGEAYQMDWGFVYVTTDYGITIKCACFTMICHHCGTCYIEFFPNAKQENLFIGMIHAFRYMGIPRYILTDNMKSVVIKRDFDGNPIWQKDYEDFMKTVGFQTKLCKPRHPFTKGKVERLVRFVKENFLVGRSFLDITDLNQSALDWCNRQNAVYHRATDCVPQQLHETSCSKRTASLLETQQIFRYLCPLRKISFDGFVNYEGRRFGVPYRYTGSLVRVRRENTQLYIYSADARSLLVTHTVTWSKQDRYCKDQYANPEQPEEFPTAAIHTEIRKLPLPASNLSFEKFNFDKGGEQDE
jgi:transposase